jgi:hypothetical protein
MYTQTRRLRGERTIIPFVARPGADALTHPLLKYARVTVARAPSATREREERALAEPRERVLWRAGGATHITHERAQPCVLGQCSSHTTHTFSACGTGAF